MSPAKTAPSAAPARGARTRPELRLRMRVMCGDVNAIGPGKIELLEAIQAHRSITAAAGSAGAAPAHRPVNRALPGPSSTNEAHSCPVTLMSSM